MQASGTPSLPLPSRAGCALRLLALDRPLSPDDQALLSSDEQERAERYRFDRDRHRFMAARAGLRVFLAAHLDLPAEVLRFDYGEQGKPSLVQAPRCRFNLSHSEGWGLVALNLGDDGEVGVDIEQLRPIPDAVSLAEASFNPADAQALRSLAEPLRSRAFLNAWTRAEACLKALGTGFSGPGLPAVGIEPASAQLRLASMGTAGRPVKLETFDLAGVDAVASIAVLAPSDARRARCERTQAA